MLLAQADRLLVKTRRIRLSPDLKLSLLAGVATGLIGVLAFGIVHAILITPIWTDLIGGLPFAIVGGAAVGWAFYELRAAGRFTSRLRGGLLFGGLIWLTLVPMTAVDVMLRKAGIRTAIGDWEVLVSVIFALAGGFLAGWLLTRRRRAAIALSLTTLVLAAGMGGPVPITGTLTAAGLFASFLLIYTLCGGVLAVIHTGLTRACGHTP